MEEDIYSPFNLNINKETEDKRKSKNTLKANKTIFKKSPRICVFEKESTGQMVTVYRCQNCPSFVRKNQPKCAICSNTSQIVKKKLTASQKLIISSKLKDSKRFKTTKPRKKSVGKGRKVCIECGRRTRCKDAVCKICKTNDIKLTSKDTADNTKNDVNTKELFLKKPIIKLQSIVIKPASKNATNNMRNYSLSTCSEADRGRNIEGITRSNTSPLVHSDSPDEAYNLENYATRDFSSIVSDLDNLLVDPEKQISDSINDSLFVSMEDINQVFNTNE